LSDGIGEFEAPFAYMRASRSAQYKESRKAIRSMKERYMSTRDDSRNQQGSTTGSQSSTQQGGGSSSSSSGQQDQYSPSNTQQGASDLARRGSSGGSVPSLWGSRGGPFEMMRRLDEDMDRLFNQLWSGGRSLMRGGRGGDVQPVWMPQVEVFERDGKLHVHADLPGMKKDDVKLSIEADQLVIQGERRSSHEEGGQQAGFYHSERSYGSFYRAIPLPEGVDTSKADANFKDGVLDVSFDAPKKQQAQSRNIEIRDT
jgi:HSP20 family protein